MNPVFEKTRELGEAIMNSEEYKLMKAAEKKAMQNADAAMTMGKYLEHKSALEELLAQEHPDAKVLSEHSQAMDEMQQRLQMIDDIVNLNEARSGFTALINQVNQVLRFIITGEMDDPNAEGGCGGSCEQCGGGCHTMN